MNRTDFTAHPLPAGLDAHSVFRSLFGAYPDAMLLVDKAGAIVLASVERGTPNGRKMM